MVERFHRPTGLINMPGCVIAAAQSARNKTFKIQGLGCRMKKSNESRNRYHLRRHRRAPRGPVRHLAREVARSILKTAASDAPDSFAQRRLVSVGLVHPLRARQSASDKRSLPQ
jgi:hypothetical protein